MKQLYEYKFSQCETILAFHVFVKFDISAIPYILLILQKFVTFKNVFFCENTALKKKKISFSDFLNSHQKPIISMIWCYS